MNKSQLVIITGIVVFVLVAVVYRMVWVKGEETPITQETAEKTRNGEVKQYTADGRLKTMVNYDRGTKHGISYLFHEDGETVLLAMPYDQGKREGISKKYYESGQLYAETSYQNDLLHGPRKVYYSNGRLKSEVHYFEGLPGTGTQEYLINGNEKEKPSIHHHREGNYVALESRNCEDADFFIGKLIGDRFFNYLDDRVTRLPKNEGTYYIDLTEYTPSYLKYQDIICSCESSQGNPVILKKRFQF